MLHKWHVCKEGHADSNKNDAAAHLHFLNYLAFLQPAADRTALIYHLKAMDYPCDLWIGLVLGSRSWKHVGWPSVQGAGNMSNGHWSKELETCPNDSTLLTPEWNLNISIFLIAWKFISLI
jgi:hypothetical protein